jgi:hypothetical protein
MEIPKNKKSFGCNQQAIFEIQLNKLRKSGMKRPKAISDKKKRKAFELQASSPAQHKTK